MSGANYPAFLGAVQAGHSKPRIAMSRTRGRTDGGGGQPDRASADRLPPTAPPPLEPAPPRFEVARPRLESAPHFGVASPRPEVAPPRLTVAGMTKRFGSLVALDDVSLTLEPGSFHALLGENGAGKSTLVKCVMGYYTPDKGTVILGGVEQTIRGPRDAHALGIGMVYQHFTLEIGRASCRKECRSRWSPYH